MDSKSDSDVPQQPREEGTSPLPLLTYPGCATIPMDSSDSDLLQQPQEEGTSVTGIPDFYIMDGSSLELETSETERRAQRRKRSRQEFTTDEDQAILQHININSLFPRLGGISVWQDMVEALNMGHTAQSLKERFRKVIMRNLVDYNLKPEVQTAFLTKVTMKHTSPREKRNSGKKFAEGDGGEAPKEH